MKYASYSQKAQITLVKWWAMFFKKEVSKTLTSRHRWLYFSNTMCSHLNHPVFSTFRLGPSDRPVVTTSTKLLLIHVLLKRTGWFEQIKFFFLRLHHRTPMNILFNHLRFKIFQYNFLEAQQIHQMRLLHYNDSMDILLTVSAIIVLYWSTVFWSCSFLNTNAWWSS